jgi:hypothetical protein
LISYLLLRDSALDRQRSAELTTAVERAQLIARATAKARDLAAAKRDRAKIRAQLKGIADRLAGRAGAGAGAGAVPSTSDQQLRAFVARLRGLAVGGDGRLAPNDPKLRSVLAVGSGSLAANFDQQVATLISAQGDQRALMRNLVTVLLVFALAMLATALLLRLKPGRLRAGRPRRFERPGRAPPEGRPEWRRRRGGAVRAGR